MPFKQQLVRCFLSVCWPLHPKGEVLQDRHKIWRGKLPKLPIDGEGILSETPDHPQRSKNPPTSEFKGKPSNVSRSFNLQARPTGHNMYNKNEALQ